MRLIGNLIWFFFGGVQIAIEYLVSSVALMMTIIGIPFGLQTLKLGLLALWPFGQEVRRQPTSGCLNTGMNVLWFFIGGLWIAITHVLLGCVFYITILGIPFAHQHFKLAHIALTPFGREIV